MKTFTRSLQLLACAAVLGFGNPASAKDLPTIRVGWSIPAEEMKYWMMRRADAFPELGKSYRIEWTQFQGTAPMVQAMLAGALDCSSQAPLSLGQGALSSGLQAYAIAQHVAEAPGSFSLYWAVQEDSPINSIADLKGKTVGVNVYGSGSYGQMAMLLKHHGLDPAKDIKLVETGFPGSEAALRAGRIDAAVMNQPFAVRAEAKGGVRKLFALADLMPNTVHLLEVCRKDFVDANPELAKHYMTDLQKAMSLLQADRPQTLAVVSEVTRAPTDLLDQYLLKENDFARDPQAQPDFAGMQKMFDQYLEVGLLKAPLQAEQFRPTVLLQP